MKRTTSREMLAMVSMGNVMPAEKPSLPTRIAKNPLNRASTALPRKHPNCSGPLLF